MNKKEKAIEVLKNLDLNFTEKVKHLRDGVCCEDCDISEAIVIDKGSEMYKALQTLLQDLKEPKIDGLIYWDSSNLAAQTAYDENMKPFIPTYKQCGFKPKEIATRNLKRIAEVLNDGRDWENETQYKYFIYYDCKYHVSYITRYNECLVWFKSRNNALKAIEIMKNLSLYSNESGGSQLDIYFGVENE